MLQMDRDKFEKIPLAADEHGTMRIAGTRVTLDSIVALFDQGATPEQITQSFPGLKLGDVYAVVTFYVRNRDDVRAYLDKEEREAEELRQKIQAEFPDSSIRDRLLKARNEKKQGMA